MGKEILKQFLHFLGLFFISLAIVLPIRQFIIQPFLVRGESMAPNFSNFDYLFVERVSYHFRQPERGEVIVFRFPQNKSDFYIKRIIGLPAEEIMVKEGRVDVKTREGKRLSLIEPYLRSGTFIEGSFYMRLGEDEYYVLGDNRNASFDSRRWGVLPGKYIIGKVLVRIWPPTKARAFWGEEFEY